MKNRYTLIGAIGVFLLSLLVFGGIALLRIHTDIQSHAGIIAQVVEGTILPPANFVYYLLVYVLALFRTQGRYLLLASGIILSLAVTAKFVVTDRILYSAGASEAGETTPPHGRATLFALLLVLAFSLPASGITKGWLYLGQIPPNVWHNSTTIFLMPFALLLFWLSYRQLEEPTSQRLVLIGILCALNILIKPAFLFVFGVLYPVLLLRRFGLKRDLWLNLLPVLIGVLLLFSQYYMIFSLEYGNMFEGDTGIAISPFSAWSYFSANIVLSLLASLVYPLAYFLFFWRDLFESLLLQFAVAAYAVAIAIYILVTETGPRALHGNFFWQTVVCAYILFVAITVLLMRRMGLPGGGGWKTKVVLAALLLHVMAGIAYLGKVFLAGSYY